ncbi:hypothetical protein AEGHOMDF_2856 [Methylobacterium soli]|nr:hypothetical protein AEGHOMDF_2856 [Methylobacterium soli]
MVRAHHGEHRLRVALIAQHPVPHDRVLAHDGQFLRIQAPGLVEDRDRGAGLADVVQEGRLRELLAIGLPQPEMLGEPGREAGHQQAVLMRGVVEAPDHVEPGAHVGPAHGPLDQVRAGRDQAGLDRAARAAEIEDARQGRVRLRDLLRDRGQDGSVAQARIRTRLSLRRLGEARQGADQKPVGLVRPEGPGGAESLGLSVAAGRVLVQQADERRPAAGETVEMPPEAGDRRRGREGDVADHRPDRGGIGPEAVLTGIEQVDDQRQAQRAQAAGETLATGGRVRQQEEIVHRNPRRRPPPICSATNSVRRS